MNHLSVLVVCVLACTQTAWSQVFTGMSTERPLQPMQGDCGDEPCPAIDCTAELDLDICRLYANFDAQFPDVKLLSAFEMDITASVPYYQHTFGGNTSPPCAFIPLFPDMQCDTYVTVGRENTCPGDATGGMTTMGRNHIIAHIFNADPSNDQGHPLPGPFPGTYRVLLGQFAVPWGGTVSGTLELSWQAPDGGEISFSVGEFHCPPCHGDINIDGLVDGIDLGLMLGTWGACLGCPADINNDGVVNNTDLAFFLGNWGPCD